MSTEVGIRELRNHLSRYLDRVRAGEEIVVTDRGTPMARVTPYHETKLDRLIAEGLVTPARVPKDDWLPEPIPTTGGSVIELWIEQGR